MYFRHWLYSQWRQFVIIATDYKQYRTELLYHALDMCFKYTMLMIVITETGYVAIERNKYNGVCLPEKCQAMKFTIILEGNFDRNENTIAGNNNSRTFIARTMKSLFQRNFFVIII